ncbi:AgmX/PglI C-terminal domain-containing protein [Glaciecola sp. XM2]|jgi:outer membrane biosynthesis protein TonB|uniref:AgmX/PglI C-terminal domain-containing protein n=1 Tax=Glaciecola sp. XM2 TaxID=1914931 RepID=UPI001BDF3145|nr:AgmX/PglI C-terminal domain-containing protein [Glaciecola sp. XM2]MBT1451538.1 AgmX/PglI C-terminal domain-containing protein [Glaciecola sp. XM2]
MTTQTLPNNGIYFDSQLPWSSSSQENSRFVKICVSVLIITLLLAVFVSLTDVPEVPRAEQEKLPPQLAKIIQAQTPPPPPPQVEPEPEPEPEPEVIEEPEPEIPEPVVEAPVETPPAPEPEVEPELTEQEKVTQARETAKSKGVLAFQDQLASMRQQANLSNLANTDLSQGGGEASVTQRDVIAAPSLATSGGIQTSNLSSDVGAAGELEGRRNTEFVAASVGEAALATKRIETESQVIGSRDLDQIRQVLDANKGAVYSLYRRALREDPSIEGKLTVKLVIAPSGALTEVTLLDSELEAPELVERLLARISLIDFGAQNVTQTELEYAFNFLPF